MIPAGIVGALSALLPTLLDALVDTLDSADPEIPALEDGDDHDDESESEMEIELEDDPPPARPGWMVTIHFHGPVSVNGKPNG